MFETRLLGNGDYEQVAQLIEERFATFVEYDKIRHKTFVSIEPDGFEEFQAKSISGLQAKARDLYLNEGRPAYRMFGALMDGRLMSLLAMHIISNHEWMIDNLKAREAPLSQTGLKEIFSLAYQTVKRLNLDTYYCQMAAYRVDKFSKFLNRFVPEHREYEGEIIRTIPAHSFENAGRKLPIVDLVTKRMCLRSEYRW